MNRHPEILLPLLALSCAQAPNPDATQNLRIVEIAGVRLSEPGVMSFDAEKIHADLGCNQIGANIVEDESGAAGFQNIVSTRMACPDNEAESLFLRVLPNINRRLDTASGIDFYRDGELLLRLRR